MMSSGTSNLPSLYIYIYIISYKTLFCQVSNSAEGQFDDLGLYVIAYTFHVNLDLANCARVGCKSERGVFRLNVGPQPTTLTLKHNQPNPTQSSYGGRELKCLSTTL